MGTQNSQKGVQVQSKAKSLGRDYQRQFIMGDSSVDPLEFDGLNKLMPAAQIIDAASTAFNFEMLDEIMSTIKSKDGQVDFFMTPDITIRKYMTALRAQGGANATEVRTMPDGQQIMLYRGIPIFRNDYIPLVVSGGTTTTDIYAGCFDDGSRKVGIAGLTSSVQSGIFITDVGEAELTNDTITRLRFYSSMAIFSELGIARYENVKVKG
jgi:hypothetical protein